MDLINRYLQAVKFWLPKNQKQDIIAELAEDLRSQIEDREAELGRKLNESEVADLLKQRGRPVLVANRFLPQDSLIGPVLFPIYLFVLILLGLFAARSGEYGFVGREPVAALLDGDSGQHPPGVRCGGLSSVLLDDEGQHSGRPQCRERRSGKNRADRSCNQLVVGNNVSACSDCVRNYCRGRRLSNIPRAVERGSGNRIECGVEDPLTHGQITKENEL